MENFYTRMTGRMSLSFEIKKESKLQLEHRSLLMKSDSHGTYALDGLCWGYSKRGWTALTSTQWTGPVSSGIINMNSWEPQTTLGRSRYTDDLCLRKVTRV